MYNTGLRELSMTMSKLIYLRTTLILTAFLLLNSAVFAAQLETKDVPRMSIAELKSHLDDPNFTIIDVRSTADWQVSTTKIKGAIREEPQQVNDWIGKYSGDKIIVLY
jgi:hypothetical protein